MRISRFILGFIVAVILLAGSNGFAQQIILQDSVVGNVHLTADKTVLIRGYVYVVDGATLTIDAGTVLFGEKSTKGCIIVERGGKIMAQGTAARPIIFTSQNAVGSRASGDWGGIILCGRAPINQNNTTNGGLFDGGDAQIEGGPRTHYGGTIANDNSGVLSYVRIEFPGIPLAPNSEINGLTLGGVGSATQIDHIQVSYSGDDSYEWFGGSVNAKYIIAFKGLDDDFDTDFGFSGKVQFGVSLRDPNIADISLSNGIESDNDNPPNYSAPRTSAMFCNMTVVGPQSDTAATYNPLFGRGAHIRRNSELSIYNSIVMGWPGGLLLDASGVTDASKNDTLQIRNCIWAGLRSGNDFMTNVAGFNPFLWFTTAAYNNRALVQPISVLLADPFNQTKPDWHPTTNSPALQRYDFTNSRLANDNFFDKVQYVGAFGTGARWDSVWANYDPQNTSYDPTATANIASIAFSNVTRGTSKDSAIVVLKNTGIAPVTITAASMMDSSLFKIIGASVPFTLLRGDTKTMTIRFAPVDTGSFSTKLEFTYTGASGNQSVQINVTGTAVLPMPTLVVEASHDFYQVQVNQSVTNTIDISNAGSATLSISAVTLTGADASQFAIVNGGAAGDIAPGAKQTVSVKFSPTSAGDKNATLQFGHNAPGGIKTVSLKGKGIVVYGQDILQDSIVGNITLTNDRTWLLRGYVYVVDGATLNIEPGTVIYGEKATKACLIVERGGKLIADGTQTEPILFLSQVPPGQRASGDWGGIILCGKAPINQNNSDNGGLFAGGDAQIEGGPRTHYGGTDAHDNSGVLRYVRIEFPGIPLAPNNEINGLTLGGVGDGTIIDHVQVSYSGDDSYEWFGGTVNCKHIIAFKGLDDDFDTDFGYSGHVQFGFGLRDPNIADVSLSNGFESDNDNPANFWAPRTKAVFCNMTVVGPQPTTTSPYNPLFGRGAHIRRNSELSIMNSIVMGWPTGLLLDASGVVNAGKNDTMQIRNCIWAGLIAGTDFTTNVNGFDAAAWYRTPAYGNLDYAQPADVKLNKAFDQTSPDPTPASGSPALTGASFSSNKLSDAFFTTVGYRGAFGTDGRWDSIWTNYDPVNTVYAPKPTLAVTMIGFGTVATNSTHDTTVTVVLTNTGNVVLGVSSWGLTDSSTFTIIGGNANFVLKAGASKSVSLRFHPTADGNFTSKLQFNFTTKESTQEVTLNGTSTSNAVHSSETIDGLVLFQNTPNPFNYETSISYRLPSTSSVRLDVLDLTGRMLRTLVNENQSIGTYSVRFDASGLANGTYVLRLATNGATLVKQMLISK